MIMAEKIKEWTLAYGKRKMIKGQFIGYEGNAFVINKSIATFIITRKHKLE